MAASFTWAEFLTTEGNIGTPTNLNFGSTIAVDLGPSTYPITAGTYSYEKWVKAYWTGISNKIDNLKFWMSVTGPYVSGEQINFTGQRTSYVIPTTSGSSYATSAVPTSEPGSANLSIGGSLVGSITTSTGNSDFIILQTSVSSGAPAGAVNQKTFTLQYDEL
jgi:hypothetical protein